MIILCRLTSALWGYELVWLDYQLKQKKNTLNIFIPLPPKHPSQSQPHHSLVPFFEVCLVNLIELLRLEEGLDARIPLHERFFLLDDDIFLLDAREVHLHTRPPEVVLSDFCFSLPLALFTLLVSGIEGFFQMNIYNPELSGSLLKRVGGSYQPLSQLVSLHIHLYILFIME